MQEVKKQYQLVENLISQNGATMQHIEIIYGLADISINQKNDVKYGLKLSARAKELLEKLIFDKVGADVWKLDEVCKANKVSVPELDFYFEILKLEAVHLLDSYALYIEKNRPPKERFYLPRRKTLKKVVDKLQALEDDELDELFVHMPARIGKTQIMTIYAAWHCARDTEASNLYCTYKESLGGAFLDGVMEMWTDPTYCHLDVFPKAVIVYTDAKNHKVDLQRKKKYKSLSGKGLESGLNGEYDAKGVLIIDDIIEGIQDVLNPETLKRKQTVFDNNLMSRAKEKCKIIYNGTIWSLHDIYMN